MYSHILLSYDGSEHAKKAAERAAKLAAAFGAHVTIVTAYPTSPSFILGTEPISDEEMRSYWVAKADELDDVFISRNVSIDKIIRAADPKHLILDTAEELEVDAIFIGSRGLSNYARFMLGGVSQSVVQHAHCDVIVVK